MLGYPEPGGSFLYPNFRIFKKKVPGGSPPPRPSVLLRERQESPGDPALSSVRDPEPGSRFPRKCVVSAASWGKVEPTRLPQSRPLRPALAAPPLPPALAFPRRLCRLRGPGRRLADLWESEGRGAGEGWAVDCQARAAGQARSEPRAEGPVSQELGARPVRPRGEQVLEQRPPGRPATAAFDGQGRLLPGLLIRMQIQLWSPFLWRQTEGCLCVCKDETGLNKPSSIGWVSKNKPVGQTLDTSSPPPDYKVWICYNSLTRGFSPLLLVSLLIKRPRRAWRQTTEAQSGGNCS